MSRWKCFMVSPTDRGAVTLRVYETTPGSPCPLNDGYHNAEVRIEDVPWTGGEQCHGYGGASFPKDDPRWPTVCGCGQLFTPSAYRQHNVDRIFAGVRNGQTVEGVHGNIGPVLPPGATWLLKPDEWQYKHYKCQPGPDGLAVAVRLPAGLVWAVDGEGTNGCRWTRTGTPPEITMSPSINFTGSYHGWVQNGYVTEECEGRRFDDLGRRVRP
jgi:hypothetical protein